MLLMFFKFCSIFTYYNTIVNIIISVYVVMVNSRWKTSYLPSFTVPTDDIFFVVVLSTTFSLSLQFGIFIIVINGPKCLFFSSGSWMVTPNKPSFLLAVFLINCCWDRSEQSNDPKIKEDDDEFQLDLCRWLACLYDCSGWCACLTQWVCWAFFLLKTEVVLMHSSCVKTWNH